MAGRGVQCEEVISGHRHAPDPSGLGIVATVAPGGSIVVPRTAGIGAQLPMRAARHLRQVHLSSRSQYEIWETTRSSSGVAVP